MADRKNLQASLCFEPLFQCSGLFLPFFEPLKQSMSRVLRGACARAYDGDRKETAIGFKKCGGDANAAASLGGDLQWESITSWQRQS